jgi:hypothetical protein
VQGLLLIAHRLSARLDQLGVKQIGAPGEQFGLSGLHVPPGRTSASYSKALACGIVLSIGKVSAGWMSRLVAWIYPGLIEINSDCSPASLIAFHGATSSTCSPHRWPKTRPLSLGVRCHVFPPSHVSACYGSFFFLSQETSIVTTPQADAAQSARFCQNADTILA